MVKESNVYVVGWGGVSVGAHGGQSKYGSLGARMTGICICELTNVGYGIQTLFLYRMVTTLRYWSLSLGPFE